jgi:hypothetical protein
MEFELQGKIEKKWDFYFSKNNSDICMLSYSDVKPTFFQDRLLSFSYKRPPQKSNLFIFETKFIIGTKRSLSDLKIFGPKAIGLFSFQIYLETTKNFVLILEICELNPNVLVLFLSF